jgi:hypothetical protein
VAKVIINGMVYEYDGTKAPMSEALAIEDVYKRRYAEWQSDLQAGSAKAMCVLAWIILRRDGTEMPFEDILSGKFDFDLAEMLESLAESAGAAQAEAAEADPTPPPAPAGTDGTGTATSQSSPASSTSVRGRSASSKSRTSRP